MLDETLDALNVRAGGRYVDGTLGRAGHACAVIARGGRVLGIDRDDQALEEVARLGLEGLTAVKGEHGNLEVLAHENGWTQVDGVLLDLGVSSPQLDEPGRGFSFLREGPLDMRMDRARPLTAAALVAEWDAPRLEDVFRRYGEEPNARRLARALVEARARGTRFETTTDLAGFVERLVGRRGAHHPATRVFQALRMAVNDEMGELERALDGALRLLAPGGRLVVITFESLTDRVVKRFFSEHAGRMVSLQQGGERWEGALPRVRPVTRKPLVAGENEVESNPRARSAKVRAVEKEAEA
jgi:16S rRNA (cytosine1402-N4)-methyltransferase